MSQWNDDVKNQLNNLPAFPPKDEWKLGDYLGGLAVRPAAASAAALPMADNAVGDVRFAVAESSWYAWDGAAWNAISLGGDILNVKTRESSLADRTARGIGPGASGSPPATGYNDAGWVGIGTSDPTKRIHIYTDIDQRSVVMNENKSGGIYNLACFTSAADTGDSHIQMVALGSGNVNQPAVTWGLSHPGWNGVWANPSSTPNTMAFAAMGAQTKIAIGTNSLSASAGRQIECDVAAGAVTINPDQNSTTDFVVKGQASASLLSVDVSANTVSTGKTVFAPATQTLAAASDTIAPTTSYHKVTSSAGSLSMSSTPTIAAGAAGQTLIIQNVAAADTITLSRGAAQKLSLGAATRAIGPGGSITLIFDGSNWVETAFVAATSAP